MAPTLLSGGGAAASLREVATGALPGGPRQLATRCPQAPPQAPPRAPAPQGPPPAPGTPRRSTRALEPSSCSSGNSGRFLVATASAASSPGAASSTSTSTPTAPPTSAAPSAAAVPAATGTQASAPGVPAAAATGSAAGAAAAPAAADAADAGGPLHLPACAHFINLTNGLEALPVLQQLGLPYSFVRIQSTACEQQNLELLLTELDPTLLLHLALGYTCIVYDCGSRGREGVPRALWYGLEFVRYTLNKLWLRRPVPALLRGKNVARAFDDHIRACKQSTLRRLQYYAKYIPPEGQGSGPPCIRLYGAYRPTDHDTDTAFYVRLMHDHQLPYGAYGRGERSGSATWRGLAAMAEGGVAEGAVAEGGVAEGAQQAAEASSGDSGAGHRAVQGAAAAAEGVQGHHSGAGGDGGGGAGRCDGLGPSVAVAASAGVAAPAGGGAVSCTPAAGAGVGAGGDGEEVLAAFGFKLFRRGLSQAEWAARPAQGGPEDGVE